MSEAVRKAKQLRLEELGEEYLAVSKQYGQALNAATRLRLERQMKELEGQMAQLESELKAIDTDSTPPQTVSTSTASIENSREKFDIIRLRDLMIENFNTAEIEDLCFILGIEMEDIGGSGKSGKIRELIRYCERRQELPGLVAELRKQRPKVDW